MDDDKTLADAKAEVARLMLERAKIDRRLIGLQRIIEGLQFLKESERSPAVSFSTSPRTDEYGGFTGFLKMLFATCRVPLTATDVRNFVKAAGVEESNSENLLNHVHGVIARLRKHGTVQEVSRDMSKPSYSWSPSCMEMTPTPDAVEKFRSQFNLASFETRVAAVPLVYRDLQSTGTRETDTQSSVKRATPARSSLAEQFFAIDDAKKRGKKS